LVLAGSNTLPWIFICHSGPDKRFATDLRKELQGIVNAFVDQEDIRKGTHGDKSMQNALTKSVAAVVLLAKEVFQRPDPLAEIVTLVDSHYATRLLYLLPVFLGVTYEEAAELAAEDAADEAALAADDAA
jgi:hypothetical protein